MPTNPTLPGLMVALAVAAMAATACSGQRSESADASEGGPRPTVTAAPFVEPDASSTSPTPAPAPTPTPTPEFGTPLASALGLPSTERTTVRPVALRYPGIGVEVAPIDPVGVEPDGEMEIPGADAVGWYEFGPTPGQVGSAVLAAHIAFDGVDGVFRDLVDSEIDDVFTVVFDDGSERDYEIVERAQYEKTELPFDRVFARSGPPVITLISCGGDFQRSVRSYQDNIVAYAVPAGSSQVDAS